MSFSIVLMNNQQELNRISKTPSTVMTLTGELREETSIVNPEIIVEYNGTLTNVNYMYISTFHRYYFINNIESIRTGLWKIYAHCDVLKTYAQAILGCDCVVARNQNEYNLMLNDAYFKVYSNPRLQVINFPNKFTGESNVLVMKGCQFISVP
ncbi:MAG: hypothetical protein J6S67_13410 [Methanobrevibacter sp.]|nr:hypothetical protein [Methanobrevibacter sp.]